MKIKILSILFLLPTYLFSQTWSTATLSSKMRDQYKTNDSVRKLNKALIIDTTAKGKRIVALEKSVKLLQDTLNKINKSIVTLGSDFFVDTKNYLSIPALKKLDLRLTNLEKPVLLKPKKK